MVRVEIGSGANLEGVMASMIGLSGDDSSVRIVRFKAHLALDFYIGSKRHFAVNF
jgi:hypothetical protein